MNHEHFCPIVIVFQHSTYVIVSYSFHMVAKYFWLIAPCHVTRAESGHVEASRLGRCHVGQQSVGQDEGSALKPARVDCGPFC